MLTPIEASTNTLDDVIIYLTTLINTRLSFFINHQIYLRQLNLCTELNDEYVQYFKTIFKLNIVTLQEAQKNSLTIELAITAQINLYKKLLDILKKKQSPEISLMQLAKIIEFHRSKKKNIRNLLQQSNISQPDRVSSALHDYEYLNSLLTLILPHLPPCYDLFHQMVQVQSTYLRQTQATKTHQTSAQMTPVSFHFTLTYFQTKIHSIAKVKSEVFDSKIKNLKNIASNSNSLALQGILPTDLDSLLTILKFKEKVSNANKKSEEEVEALIIELAEIINPVYRLSLLLNKAEQATLRNKQALKIKISIQEKLSKMNSQVTTYENKVSDYQQTYASHDFKDILKMFNELENEYLKVSIEYEQKLMDSEDDIARLEILDETLSSSFVDWKEHVSDCLNALDEEIDKIRKNEEMNRKATLGENERLKKEQIEQQEWVKAKNQAYHSKIESQRAERQLEKKAIQLKSIRDAREVKPTTVLKETELNQYFVSIIKNMNKDYFSLLKAIVTLDKNTKIPKKEIESLIVNHLHGKIQNIGNGSSHRRIQLHHVYVEVIDDFDENISTTPKTTGGFFVEHGKSHTEQYLCRVNVQLISNAFKKAGITIDLLNAIEIEIEEKKRLNAMC